jgi:cellulose synthase operon protein C
MVLTYSPRCRQWWLTAALGVMMTAVLGVSGCVDDDATLLASARSYIEKHDAEAAKIQLKTLLQHSPQSGEARFLLGKLLLEGGEIVGAEIELRRALDAGWSNEAVLPVLAKAMLAQGKGPALVLQFGQTDLPDALADAELKTQIASAQAAGGDLTAAEETIATALRRRPDYVPAQLVQAGLVAARGDSARAQTLADAMAGRTPEEASVWALRGDLLLQGDRGRVGKPALDAAAAAYRQSLALMPEQPAVQSALMTVLLRQRDFDAANAQWAQMNKVLPHHPQTLFFEAVLADQRGDAKRTREITQLLLRGGPDNPRLLMLAGDAELKLGELALAQDYLAKAVQLVPKAALPRRLLAQAQLRAGKADRALATLGPLLESNAPDADVLTLAGQAQLISGDSKAADASFTRAARIKPGDSGARTALALSQLAKPEAGKDATAFAELEHLAAEDKGSSVDMALISAYLRRNDVAGSLKAIDTLAAKQPQNPLADQLRGRIELRRGDTAAARKSFERALGKDAAYVPALGALAALDLAEQKPLAARQRFEALLVKDPRNVQAMLALALIGAGTGAKPEEVQQWLDRAVSTAPDNAAARLRLVDYLLLRRQAGPALDAARAAVAALPDDPEVLDRLGSAQLMDGHPLQAVTTFTKLAGLLPKSPRPRLRLADAQLAAGDTAGAAASVRRALEIAPDSQEALQAGITLALRDNKPEQAVALARGLQARRPDLALGFQLEGDIEANRKNWDASAAAYRKALAKAQPGDAAQRLYGALVAGGKSAEAERLSASWQREHPNDLGFVLYLGDVALEHNALTEAEQHYRALLARQPDHLLALNNLAYVLAMQKKPGGVALAEKAVSLAPAQPGLMDTLAFCLAAEQQLPKALELQAKVVKQAPEAPEFRLQLARLQLQSGDKSSARGELNALAKLGPAFGRQAEVAELLKQAGG